MPPRSTYRTVSARGLRSWRRSSRRSKGSPSSTSAGETSSGTRSFRTSLRRTGVSDSRAFRSTTERPMREDDGARAAILVSNRQHLPVDADGLAAVARKALAGQAAGACELSVSFVDDDEMSELHHRYAGEDGPTDVLSFPMDELDVEGTRILGDVV